MVLSLDKAVSVYAVTSQKQLCLLIKDHRLCSYSQSIINYD
uniref:Uncharacterized protein n=1 Tax=Arundo donax TaxID=35708 RepID=A0A0A9FHE5_ARUDO